MNRAGNIMVGFLAGAIAGVTTGILVAPNKGEKTRKMLKNKVKGVSKDITDKIGEQIDHLEVKIKNLKNKMYNGYNGEEIIKDAASHVKSEAKKAVHVQ